MESSVLLYSITAISERGDKSLSSRENKNFSVPAHAAKTKQQNPESKQNLGNIAFWGILVLIALVLLIAAVGASENRKAWEQSLAAFTPAQQALADGDYEQGLEYFQSMSPSYRVSYSAQLIIGSCYAGLAEATRAAGQEETSQEYLALAAQHLDVARAKNFHLVESQGYVNGYARVMMDLGNDDAARQYFLQSIKLNTYPEFTDYAQEQLELLKTRTDGGEDE